MALTLGIDPGTSGGLVLLNESGAIEDMYTMPFDKTVFNSEKFRQVAHRASHVFIEKVGVWSKGPASKKSCFTFGYNSGLPEGILIGMKIPYERITPHFWQKRICIGCKAKESKARSLEAALRLFPGVNFKLKTKIHDGIVDAALIGLAGQRYCLK